MIKYYIAYRVTLEDAKSIFLHIFVKFDGKFAKNSTI